MSDKGKVAKMTNDIKAIASLNEKYLPFVVAYISTGSITKASEEVGVTKLTGCRWLKNADVQQLLISKRNELAFQVDVSGQDILKELKGLAFSNIEDYLTEEGQIKPLSEMPNTGAIQELIVTDKVIGEGENQRKERTTKIKLVDKLSSLKQISDSLGLFVSKEASKPTVINFNGMSTEDIRKLLDRDTIDITAEEV